MILSAHHDDPINCLYRHNRQTCTSPTLLRSVVTCRLTHSQDNPLHIAIFPPHTSTPSAHLEFSFLLNASLDIFDARARDRNQIDQDLGMLQAIDERLSIWGWETGTGTRFAIVADAWGRGGNKGSRGLSDGDLRGVSRYVSLVK